MAATRFEVEFFTMVDDIMAVSFQDKEEPCAVYLWSKNISFILDAMKNKSLKDINRNHFLKYITSKNISILCNNYSSPNFLYDCL